MALSRVFCKAFSVSHPVLQAPMAGGPSTVAMAVATAKQGGLAAIAAAGLSGAELREQLEKFAASVPRNENGALPLVVNFFSPQIYTGSPSRERVGLNLPSERIEAAVRHHDEMYKSLLGSSPAEEVNRQQVASSWKTARAKYEDAFATALSLKPVAISFVFGPPPPEEAAAAKRQGIRLMATATSKDEAIALADSGMDAVILQGREAGGHRSTFHAPTSAAEAQRQLHDALTVVQLLQATREALPEMPLIAAGGLSTPESIALAKAAGADGIQIGTALLLTKEAGCSEPYQAALREHADDRPVVFTRAFSGRWARGLCNAMTEAASGGNTLPFPFQQDVLTPLRKSAKDFDRGRGDKKTLLQAAECINLWAGDAVASSVRLYDGKSTSEVVRHFATMFESAPKL
mmetsp:Transcript_69574/g.166879  ORF Transcript_69574/g.166879 Transcript_69574/m.166879 type:complete len:405 (-) Transcript_69574:204-1418(-)